MRNEVSSAKDSETEYLGVVFFLCAGSYVSHIKIACASTIFIVNISLRSRIYYFVMANNREKNIRWPFNINLLLSHNKSHPYSGNTIRMHVVVYSEGWGMNEIIEKLLAQLWQAYYEHVYADQHRYEQIFFNTPCDMVS